MPKQFLLLADRPLIAHTLQRLETAELITEVVVVAAQAWIPHIQRDIIGRFHFEKCRQVVAGGRQRQDSVWAGLQVLPAGSADIVVVHDAVRPLFSTALLQKVIATCEEFDGCIPAMAPRDTVKKVVRQSVRATIARESLRLAQTPQAFRREILDRAFTQAQADHFCGTDEASLVERIAGRIAWVEGEETNLKITTPRDLAIAELFYKERH